MSSSTNVLFKSCVDFSCISNTITKHSIDAHIIGGTNHETRRNDDDDDERVRSFYTIHFYSFCSLDQKLVVIIIEVINYVLVYVQQ
jgi:hypothetical protein